MQISELDYHLPEELIADRPIEPRDSCRMMVVHRSTGHIEHRHFTDLFDYLSKDDLLVFNSARVIPARLFAYLKNQPHKMFEILVTNSNSTSTCHALIYPSKKIQSGMCFISKKTRQQILVCKCEIKNQWELKLEETGFSWNDFLKTEGHMPIPPYILKRRDVKSDLPEDRVWYQTVYADRDGAIAAPTAGLHFSEEMFEKLHQKGIQTACIFLKVGIGTFQPVRTQTLEEHVLHPEEYEVNQEAADQIRRARSQNSRIIAVGTTTTRTLEFCASKNQSLQAEQGMTDLLIQPPYSFKMVHALITNFHLPKSTLLALVYALGGTELIRQAYEEAIREKYRFFSYGDAMMIL